MTRRQENRLSIVCRKAAKLLLLCSVMLAYCERTAQATPPFSGTIFIDPDIITAADPTTFQSAPYAGQGLRLMFDRRINNWANFNAYLFNATFNDGLSTEIQVNPEFGSPAAASTEAVKYGAVIGRLPTALRADVDTVWIHRGTQPFGGGNNNLLIHTGQADSYAATGILEETLVHEASHTSLDAAHAESSGWRAAQAADGEFISTYARDNPTREDIAESFLPYLAVNYRSDRISSSLAATISQTIPNRIAYFDNQSFNLYPLVSLPIAGDVNNDGLVNRLDAAQFAVNFGRQSGSTWANGDFDDDRATTVADWALLQSHFGHPSSSPIPVPEPSMLALLVFASPLIRKMRRVNPHGGILTWR
jgi:hypothetical protein